MKRIIIACLTATATLTAFDLPQFYRAPFFYGQQLYIEHDWETFTSLRYAAGSTHTGFDRHGHRINILQWNGCTDLSTLGQNVETNSSCCAPIYKPLTAQFLGPDGIIPNMNLTCNNGLLSYCGHFKTWEVDIDWWQNLRWGFFLYAYLPIRHLEVNDISMQNLTDPANQNAAAINSFLHHDFNRVLAENGLRPPCTPFRKTGLADPALAGGWRGSTTLPKGIMSEIAGLIETVVTFPIATSRRNESFIFSLPMGYEEHWGIGFRLQAEAGIRNWFSLGVTGGTLVFLSKKNCFHLQTACGQNGPFRLESGRAAENTRQMWDAGCYIKTNRFLRGISLMWGYSYTKRERTRIDVQDCCVMYTLMQQQCAYPGNPVYRTNKNTVASANHMLDAWDMHTFHWMIELDLDYLLKSSWAPYVNVSYDFPFTGQHSWRTGMVGGTAGLRLKWNI